MDPGEAERIVGSAMTVSDKIRALNAARYPRAEIARLLGKRYQHVRNVLEADKVNRPPVDPPAATGFAEASQPFGGVHRLAVEADGSVRLPPEVQAALGVRPGGLLITLLEDDRLVVLSSRAAWKRVQDMLAPYNDDPTRLISEELIAERHAGAIWDD